MPDLDDASTSSDSGNDASSISNSGYDASSSSDGSYDASAVSEWGSVQFGIQRDGISGPDLTLKSVYWENVWECGVSSDTHVSQLQVMLFIYNTYTSW